MTDFLKRFVTDFLKRTGNPALTPFVADFEKALYGFRDRFLKRFPASCLPDLLIS